MATERAETPLSNERGGISHNITMGNNGGDVSDTVMS